MQEGGLGVVYKLSLHMSPLTVHSHTYCEASFCSVSLPFSRTFKVSFFYRSPSYPITPFLDEFNYYITHSYNYNINLWEINIPTNLPSNILLDIPIYLILEINYRFLNLPPMNYEIHLILESSY